MGQGGVTLALQTEVTQSIKLVNLSKVMPKFYTIPEGLKQDSPIYRSRVLRELLQFGKAVCVCVCVCV